MEDRWAHICSAAVDRPAADAMAFLQAPENLASWAIGLGDATVHPDGTVEGAFPETGAPIWALIDADPERGTILFHLGPDRDSLVPRIMIRVVPGDVLECDPRTCVVSLIAWRQAGMDDARWSGLRSGHESEIRELKRLIEAAGR
ncbi:MAG: hypothetical protein F4027_03565 [Rhodospirillaceae bacterium]|nr:hypothetical protein [Rhodospirillaceae bacterium]MYH38523.1 hypothetical protein [Rhodospirillaceae bacterium]MYK14150.1 hypothetical protein [Rhodospirillaceae bacterium]MYK57715.1 hypothetical protein [Rhodospirillaceae bacterium]